MLFIIKHKNPPQMYKLTIRRVPSYLTKQHYDLFSIELLSTTVVVVLEKTKKILALTVLETLQSQIEFTRRLNNGWLLNKSCTRKQARGNFLVLWTIN